MPAWGPPSPENDFLALHVELIRCSLRQLTGRDLVEPGLSSSAGACALFEAPFVVLSHNTDADPVFNYANRCALELFESTWEQMTSIPSRLSAETPQRSERERLLAEVTAKGYIDNYAGIRISLAGRRFRIEQALVWNLLDETGTYRGQAATFSRWEFL
jgi:hypothetical protein